MKKFLFSALLLGAASVVMAQQVITFSYAPADTDPTLLGTGKSETYDLAIALTNPALVGLSIKSIQVPVVPTENISDFSIWITNELQLELVNGKNTNVTLESWSMDYPTEGDVQYVTYTLDEAYPIPAEGLYVGYSFTISVLDNVTKYPIVAAAGASDGSFCIHTSRSYRNWQDRSSEVGAALMVQVELEGEIAENNISLGDVPFNYYAKGENGTVDVSVINKGTAVVNSLEYTATVAGNSFTEELTLADPVPAIMGYAKNATFTFPAIAEPGSYDLELAVTKVNGEELATPVKTVGSIAVAAFIPKRLGLVEEYTGMWCGWCTRGYAAMEYMHENYPEFVGIAYHNSDEIALAEGHQSCSGYPSGRINRGDEVDVYYPIDTMNGFSLPEAWAEACEGFTPVEISVEAEMDADSIVTAKSTVNWAAVPGDVATANYRIEYVLTGDGLYDASWKQTNYYPSNYSYDELDYPLCDFGSGGDYGSSSVRGLIFNDVALLTSGLKGVTGSIPSISADEATEHTYTFDGKYVPCDEGGTIPYDKTKLKVVAFVLQGSGYGTVVNACKCDVKVDASALNTISANGRQVESVTYYDLQGRQVANPAAGIYVRLTRYTDGTTATTKIAK
ncbi:MAG: hypothetical protein LUD17_13135 [Bacteroidales bacterium]|nr:hypothetical protein [Bacteroidales bacterium]